MSVNAKMPWSWGDCARGWQADTDSGGAHDYWLSDQHIEGALPVSLRGTLLRNGPGGVSVQGEPLRHPIDGDGLICRIVFCGDGRAHFRSRFVDSKHRREEVQTGRLLYRGQMGSLPADFSRVRAGLDTAAMVALGRRSKGRGFRNPSNTNVLYWGGKVLTAYENQLPHHLDPLTLETVGLDDLDGALRPVKTFAAHFREDPHTGNLVTLSARPAAGPYPSVIMFSEFDRRWRLLRQQVHHVEGLNYSHDFAMTPKYFIVQMSPFVSVDKASVLKILAGISSPGELMRHYPELPSRLVVIPRWRGEGTVHDAPQLSPIHVDDTTPVHIFHFATAHDTDDGLHCTAVCLPESFDMSWDHRVWLSNVSEAPGRLCRYEVSLGDDGSGQFASLQRFVVDDSSCEFPTADPRLHGSPQRFLYLMANTQPGHNLPYRDIVKCDLSADDRGDERQVWRSDGLVGEPVFAPRGEPGDDGDEGWLLVQLYKPAEHRTEVVVLDAKNVADGPVCRLRLPHHVPFAFHATFTHEVLLADA